MKELTKCIPVDGDLVRIAFIGNEDSETVTTIHWSSYQDDTDAILKDLPKGAKRDEETRLRVWMVKEVKKALKNQQAS